MPIAEQGAILVDARRLAEAGDYESASRVAYQVLERAPNSALALHMLGYIYLQVDKQVLAYQFYRRALQIEQRHAEIWNNFGRAADELHLYHESEASFRRALSLKPDYAGAWANLAVSLINQARYDEALEAAEQSVSLDPDAPAGWINVGFASLAKGDWGRGWDGYHKALGGKFRQPVAYGDEPEWDGSPVDCLVVTGEQGLGDEICYSRMLLDAAKDCKTVVFDCDARLEGLFRRSFPGIKVFGTRKSEEVAWLADYRPDAHVALADLGRFYRRSDESFPRDAYLKADPERIAQWKAILKGKTIGLAWSGGTFLTQSGLRQAGIEGFRPLIESVDATFVSLEYRDCADEIEKSGLPVRWFERATMARDYDETAGLIGALDMVIGVPTTALHMAASLGVQTWCLAPEPVQWMFNRDDFPWYGCLQIFRKRSDESWSEAVKRFTATYA
jgi:tetratricopeptide (TPR) repeat protein